MPLPLIGPPATKTCRRSVTERTIANGNLLRMAAHCHYAVARSIDRTRCTAVILDRVQYVALVPVADIRIVPRAALPVLYGHDVARGVATRRDRHLAGGRAAHRALVGVAAGGGARLIFSTLPDLTLPQILIASHLSTKEELNSTAPMHAVPQSASCHPSDLKPLMLPR